MLPNDAHRAEASPQLSPARRNLVERVRSISSGGAAQPAPSRPDAASEAAVAAGANSSPGAAASEPSPLSTDSSSRSSRLPTQEEAAELARMRQQLERQLDDIASRQAELAQLGFGDASAPAGGGTHRRQRSITGPQLLRPTAYAPGTTSAEAAQLGPASGRLSGRVHRRSHSAESVLMPGRQTSTSSIAGSMQSSISPVRRLSPPPPDSERNVEVDDGVWLTFERSGGRNKIKRIRFSQQRFPSEASWQAWWQANKLDVAARFDLSRPPTISETSRRRLEARRQAAAVAAANGDQTSARGSDLAMGIPVDQPPTSPVSRAMPPLLAESIAGHVDSVRPSPPEPVLTLTLTLILTLPLTLTLL